MNVIKFIEEDIQRSKMKGPAKWILILSVCVLPVVLGIVLRDDTEGVFHMRVFVPNLIAGLLLIMIPLFYEKRSQHGKLIFPIMAGLMGLSLFLATERVFFPVGERTIYASSEIFWHEVERCFFKGYLSSFLVGIAITAFAFNVSSWPSRKWRVLLSLCAGVAGTVMLGFHCDSSSLEHVLVSHISQGPLLGLLIWGIQEIIFIFKMRKLLSKKISRIHNVG